MTIVNYCSLSMYIQRFCIVIEIKLYSILFYSILFYSIVLHFHKGFESGVSPMSENVNSTTGSGFHVMDGLGLLVLMGS